MSVAAVVTYRPGSVGTSYLPVATEETFRRTWLPLAEAAGLTLVPRFAEGVVIEPGQYAVLDAELSTLQADAAATVADAAELEQLLARAGELSALVRQLATRRNDVAELYIG
ncbi:hypothetical protein [Georgenia sunbinii]|uniref:hypothetical protein n=1 Tax=Georgenia sunbinii TaxID=3117728 RepID=UPI002F26331C